MNNQGTMVAPAPIVTLPTVGPAYLTGYPPQPFSRKKGRRDKCLRKFRIPCLDQIPPLLSKEIKPAQLKPFPTVSAPDFSKYPPNTGKGAKKARRRARKRFVRKQAKARAEEVARQVHGTGQLSEAEIDAQKQEFISKFYKELQEKTREQNEFKTQLMSKKAKAAEIAKKISKAQSAKMSVRDTSQGTTKKSLKRKADDEEYLNDVQGPKKKSKKAKAQAGDTVDAHYAEQKTTHDIPTSKKRKRDGEESPTVEHAKKIKTAHNKDDDDDSLFDLSPDEDEDTDTESIASTVESTDTYDPIAAIPNPYQKPTSIMDFPDEVLERVVNYCDPISQTLLGLTNKRLGRFSIASGAGFPIIRDRYGSDLERHRFMSLLHGFMNRAYTEAPQPTLISQLKAYEKLKERRLCYICRKYLPIEGKECKYWKNCPKKADMPNDPSTVRALDAEIDRRRRQAQANASGPLNPVARPAYSSLLPALKKLKPKAQTYTWKDEDWTMLSMGRVKSRKRLPDVKHICPKCTLTVHTIHLGWPPETPIVRWLEDGNPAGGKMGVGHEPVSALEYDDFDELEEDGVQAPVRVFGDVGGGDDVGGDDGEEDED